MVDKPILYYMVGLPGSGKSTWIDANKEELNLIVYSSDAIRQELGDVNDQSQNELVFNILHKRIKEDLRNGNNVVYDSTGITRKIRMHFLRQITNIPCKKVCVLCATPTISCYINNRKRDRQVPEHVIHSMSKGFNVPCKQEGWDDILIVWWYWKQNGLSFDFDSKVEQLTTMPHDNPHHKNTIGNHMIEAWKYMITKTFDFRLQMAAYMHDCGKPVCKCFADRKGNITDVAHFYNHENLSSFLSLFYLKDKCYPDDDILYISLLIELHMRPLNSWSNSEKAKERDIRFFGEKVVNDVMLVNECDKVAH